MCVAVSVSAVVCAPVSACLPTPGCCRRCCCHETYHPKIQTTPARGYLPQRTTLLHVFVLPLPHLTQPPDRPPTRLRMQTQPLACGVKTAHAMLCSNAQCRLFMAVRMQPPQAVLQWTTLLLRVVRCAQHAAAWRNCTAYAVSRQRMLCPAQHDPAWHSRPLACVDPATTPVGRLEHTPSLLCTVPDGPVVCYWWSCYTPCCCLCQNLLTWLLR